MLKHKGLQGSNVIIHLLLLSLPKVHSVAVVVTIIYLQS